MTKTLKPLYGNVIRQELYDHTALKTKEVREAVIERLRVIETDLREEIGRRERVTETERRILDLRSTLEHAFLQHQTQISALVMEVHQRHDMLQNFVADYVFARTWRGRVVRCRSWIESMTRGLIPIRKLKRTVDAHTPECDPTNCDISPSEYAARAETTPL